MTARHQRVSRPDEQDIYRDRYLTLQPSLDQTCYKLWGQLPGIDGRIVEQALTHRADQFSPLPDGKACSRTQRHADALVSLAQDSLHGTMWSSTATATAWTLIHHPNEDTS